MLGPMQEVSQTSATLLNLPGRSIKEWYDQLQDPGLHANQAQLYLRHIAEVRDMVRETTHL